MKVINKIIVVFFLIQSVMSWGQNTDAQTIGTQTIDVVRLYSPTISDANKLNQLPNQATDSIDKKIDLKYQIFSYPVVSTYSPIKGRADNLAKLEKEKIFQNYLTLGFGNYTTPVLDFYTAHALSDDRYIIGDVHHISSQGGIKGVWLDNSYYDTALRATYGVNKSAYGWDVGLGYSHQLYNWYGIPTDPNGFVFTSNTLNQMVPSQTYQSVDVKGGLYRTKSVFKKSGLGYTYFWDDKGSAENRFFASPSIEFKIEDQKVKIDFDIDYVGGDFKRGYMSALPLTYSVFNIGVSPSIVYRKNDFSFNLGASIYYSSLSSTAKTKNNLFIYPQVTGSYNVVQDILVVFTGLEGGLYQNSYKQFAIANPYVSPTLQIMPTSKSYDFYLGLRGKLQSNLLYSLRAFHYNEKDKGLFGNQLFVDGLLSQRQDYEFSNSFRVLYDDISTTGASFDVAYTWDKKITAKVNGTWASYTTSKEAQPWNLPALKGDVYLEYSFLEKWKAGMDLFYVGSRKDQQIVDVVPQATYSVVSLPGYVDLNLNVKYQYNKKLAGFLRLNNLTNKANLRWMDYPTQQFQIIAGANYKFDFK